MLKDMRSSYDIGPLPHEVEVQHRKHIAINIHKQHSTFIFGGSKLNTTLLLEALFVSLIN